MESYVNSVSVDFMLSHNMIAQGYSYHWISELFF